MSDIDSLDVRVLDGRLLLVFREVLRTGSATAAGERLGLSQSAISHALGRLRAIHADPLFVRRPHGLEPTRRALELGPRIDALIDLAAGLHRAPAEFDPATSERRFTIAAPEFVVALAGGRLLERWSTRAPRVSLTALQLDHDEITIRLRRGDIDLAIGRFAPSRTVVPGTELETLFGDEYCVVARIDHPTIRRRLDVDAYAAAGHVIAANTSEGAGGESVPRRLRITAVVPGWLTALSMVGSSDAIATCPRRLAERHAGTLGLRVLRLPGEPIPIEVDVLRRSGDHNPGIAWLAKELRRAVAR